VLAEHGIKIAPSTDYARRTAPVGAAELADAHAANILVDLYRANRGLYGLRKLRHAARRAGHPWGRDQVGRLMSIAGIDGVRRGRQTTVTTRRESSAPRHPDLVDRAWTTPSRPDQWWVADFTYVWTRAGFVYVSFVADVYSRRIFRLEGVVVEDDAAGQLGVGAGAVHPPPRQRRLHHHQPDSSLRCRVATHISGVHRGLLEAGIAGSIGSVGDAPDNALRESTIGLFKTELIDRQPSWTGRNEVHPTVPSANRRHRQSGTRPDHRRATNPLRTPHWFNTERLHSAIGYRPPVEFEERYRDTRATADLAVA
jgi:putative transposase